MNDIKGIIEDVEKSSLVSNKVVKKVIEIIGQEKWQDINDEKSDICTTTGELIVTLKGIVDLEKENEIFKKANEIIAQQRDGRDADISILENRMEKLEAENAELKKNCEDLKEFYEKEYFEIADKTANERIKELEQYETEITVDDYSPYDENTWGMMHEEMFVPKNLVLDMLKEIYAYIENLKKENAELKEDSSEWEKASDKWKNVYELTNNQLTKAKELLKKVLDLKKIVTKAEEYLLLEEAEQFLNSEVEK